MISVSRPYSIKSEHEWWIGKELIQLKF
jgi:hypothetical protein